MTSSDGDLEGTGLLGDGDKLRSLLVLLVSKTKLRIASRSEKEGGGRKEAKERDKKEANESRESCECDGEAHLSLGARSPRKHLDGREG